MKKKHKDNKQYRYKGYDYSQDGFNFVTICAKNREMFFGIIQTDKPPVGTGQCPVPTGGSKFDKIAPGSFKSIVTKNVNIKIPNNEFARQSRFYERIIRNNF